jgi:hypothetical protein
MVYNHRLKIFTICERPVSVDQDHVLLLNVFPDLDLLFEDYRVRRWRDFHSFLVVTLELVLLGV